MRTVRLSADSPDPAAIRKAAAVIRSGGLVAFPTETVYGLGANALDAAAIQRIYDAKGRPAANPLIVHVASLEMARALALDWPPHAERLARAFWPGPLTLVVRKATAVPDEATAGGPTVGLRMPAHPIALALIDAAGVPIAAPSANRSNEISPTTAAHVERSLGDRADLLLDGGPTTVGIESTVVDVTGAHPRILRPGMITAEELERLLHGAVEQLGPADGPVLRSPGLLGKHYAPRGVVELYDAADAERVSARARERVINGTRVGAMVFASLNVSGVEEHTMPTDAREYARHVYATLHTLDLSGCDLILIEQPPPTPEWRGVLDRLRRATLPG